MTAAPANGPAFTAPQAEHFGRLWDEFALWLAAPQAGRRSSKATYLAARRKFG